MNRPVPNRLPGGSPFSPHGGEGLEQAFARCQDRLLGMLYCLVGSQEDALEAFQEAFAKCTRRVDSPMAVENLEAWIFRIALNVGRDMRSSAWRRRRRPLPADESAPGDEQAPAPGSSPADPLVQVRRALLELRPGEQEVFLLRQDGQMTYDEIAQVLDVPLSTVKSRMQLALVRLRNTLPKKG